MRGEALYKGGLTRSPTGGATGLPCRPQDGRPAPLAPPLAPAGWAAWLGACRPLGGRQAPSFFLQGLRCKFEEKKLHLSPVAPPRATGVYF